MAQIQNEMDDLDNLFEFGDIDLNPLPEVGAAQYGDHMQQAQHISHPSTPFDGTALAAPPGTSAQDFGGRRQYGMSQKLDHQQQYMSHDSSQVPRSHPFTSESMFQPAVTQPYQHSHPQALQFQQLGFPQGHGAPPTPNSFEMHGEVGRFLQQPQQSDPQQRALFEQRYQLRKDDAVGNCRAV